MEDKIRISGIIFEHGKDDYGLWEGFNLTEDEENQIMEILMKHDTEGCSIRGTRKEISEEIGGVIKMCQRKTKQMREFEPILKANGYREIRSNGSHFIYSNGTNQITVNKDLNKMVRKRLIKENNLIER